jgi:hypothetical protein
VTHRLACAPTRYSSFTVKLRLLLLTSVLVLGACQNMPEPYAPPEQRQPIEVVHPYRISRVVNMDDGDAAAYFIRDIRELNGNWRWTGRRPELRIAVKANEKLHYTIDFTLPEVTFKVTGPVTVTFSVNDHLVGSQRYTAFGEQHFDAAIPDGVVAANSDATVGAEVDKPWVSPADGVELGFILRRIGLKQE